MVDKRSNVKTSSFVLFANSIHIRTNETNNLHISHTQAAVILRTELGGLLASVCMWRAYTGAKRQAITANWHLSVTGHFELFIGLYTLYLGAEC